jgi:hypothetical protein
MNLRSDHLRADMTPARPTCFLGGIQSRGDLGKSQGEPLMRSFFGRLSQSVLKEHTMQNFGCQNCRDADIKSSSVSQKPGALQ